MKPPITPETLAALEAAEPHEAVSASTASTMSMSEGTLAAFVYRAMVRAGRLRPSDLEASRDPLTPVTNLGGDDGLVDDRLRPVESAARCSAREAVEAQSPTTRAILSGRFKVESDNG